MNSCNFCKSWSNLRESLAPTITSAADHVAKRRGLVITFGSLPVSRALLSAFAVFVRAFGLTLVAELTGFRFVLTG